MWGGRFGEEPDPAVTPLLSALEVDAHLLRWDLLGSLAHLTSLAEAGVVPAEAAQALGRGLREMLAETDAGRLEAAGDYEDVHSFIEATLAARVGVPAGWLHTGRSRNDQVVTAFRLDLKDRIRRLVSAVADLQEAVLAQAERAGELLAPGYTHLQRAQPVLLAHAWLVHCWTLGRDTARLRDAYRRVDVSPLGSGAIAGTAFPVDRRRQASLLGFAQISSNSIDATGDRDFVFEAVAAVVGLLLHLSRWAEELLLWSSQEFGFVRLPDAVLTGSSLMPQKRNPDLLELVRAQAGVGLGALVGLGAVLKGVPYGYHRDLQEDKAPAVTAFQSAAMAVAAMTVVARRLEVRADRLAAALRGGFLTATEVADYLVRRGVAFREAHELAGRVVRAAEAADCELWELPLEAYRAVSPRFEADVLQAVTPRGAVDARDTPGGTAPGRVAEATAEARATVTVERAWVEQAAAAQAEAERRLLEAAPGAKPA
ncbi:MAG: argininosuccinate lyase [Armatimonadota bacterium]|nr:argininosuccinate lyase [Armatimonadota bacterium]